MKENKNPRSLIEDKKFIGGCDTFNKVYHIYWNIRCVAEELLEDKSYIVMSGPVESWSGTCHVLCGGILYKCEGFRHSGNAYIAIDGDIRITAVDVIHTADTDQWDVIREKKNRCMNAPPIQLPVAKSFTL